MLSSRLLWARRLAVVTTALTFVLMVLGSWVKANGAGLACPDWPTCYGEWMPPFPSYDNGGTYEDEPVLYSQGLILYEWAHRGVASLLGVPLIALAALTMVTKDFARPVRVLPTVTVALVGIQAGIGGGTVITGNPAWFTTLHLAMATLIFGALVATAMLVFLRPLPVDAPKAETPVAQPRRVSYVYKDETPSPSAAGDAEARDG